MPRPLLARSFPFTIWLTAGAAWAQAPAPATVETIVIEGRVVDMRGEGMPAAAVVVTPATEQTEVLGRTTADGDGYFRLGKVEKRPGLRVTADCAGKAVDSSFASGGGAVRIVVHDAARIQGLVVDRDGKPVPKIPVRAWLSTRVLRTAYDATTDADGRFVLPRVALGPVRFTAWIDGQGLAEAWQLVAADGDVRLAPRPGKATSLRITVEGLPTPAPTVSIRLLPYEEGSLRELPPPLAAPTLAADGSWQAHDLPDAEYRVSLGAAGFAFAPHEAVCKPTTGPHRLTFRASATASGTSLQCNYRVVGADGQPAAGVPMVMRHFSGGAEAAATSDAEGKLTFASPIAAGTKIVLASGDDRWVPDQAKEDGMYGTWDSRFLRNHEGVVDPGATPVVRVIPACSVRGRVRLADGRPAAFVRVMLEESRANRTPTWMEFARATTARDGSFTIARQHPMPNPVRLRVTAEAGSVEGEEFALDQPGMAVSAADLQLLAPATIEGIVRDEQQRPAAGLRVWLRDWDFQKNSQASGSVTEVITDRQGRYRFVGVPPGGAWLQLLTGTDDRGLRGRAVEPFAVEAGKTHTFELQVPPQ